MQRPRHLANEATNAVYGAHGACPNTHPYSIPRISYLDTHPNWRWSWCLIRSWSGAGVNDWEGAFSFSSMHADYFFAAQDEFTRAVDLNGDGRLQDGTLARPATTAGTLKVP